MLALNDKRKDKEWREQTYLQERNPESNSKDNWKIGFRQLHGSVFATLKEQNNWRSKKQSPHQLLENTLTIRVHCQKYTDAMVVVS